MPPVPSRPHQSALILLVDDNRDGLLARRSVLEELGYKVVAASSGRDALEQVKQNEFDLIVTDYKMDRMNGLELIAQLQQLNFAKPIILLSGFADSVGLREQNTGATVVIQKSANEITTLVRHTKRLLGLPKKSASSLKSSKKLRTGNDT